MTMGAGLYTINGYLAFGDNGGGSVPCNGSLSAWRERA